MRRVAALRPRWPRWQITAGTIGVIVAGMAAAVVVWPHAWWWLVVAAAAVVVVTPPALTAASQALQRRREMGRVTRGLQGTTGAGGRKLPTAGTADLEARVHQTVLPIPYIRRDKEDTIRAHLLAGRPVLLIGSSMVGKTKMAARVIAEEFGSWPVAVPDSKTALAELDAKGIMLHDSVIWLDDIDRLIGAGGITDGALRRLASAGNVIIGTIRSRAYDQLRPSDELRPQEWDVLSAFEHIFISRELTGKEEERVATAIADPGIRDRIRAVGLGEYVGAAGQVAEALKLGAAGADSLGYALVLAVADWRRCGMVRPIPAAMLAPLARPHLDQRGQARLAHQDAFNAALAWATRDINPNVSLLQPAGAESYILYDYALDLISAQDTPIPDSSWAAIMTDANPPELLSLGYTADAYHRNEIAIQALRQAADSGHSYISSMAAVGLGDLLAAQEDEQGAKDAYQQAIDSGQPGAAALAAVGFGDLFKEQGDIAGAKAAYQQAIDSGQPGAAAGAAVSLGDLLKEQGDIAGARNAYQQAIDSGDRRWAPGAALWLGNLLNEQGDIAGARNAYQQAIDSGEPDATPRAAVRLGDLLMEQGDIAGANAAWQQAIDSGEPDAIALAAVRLGDLLKEQGDIAGAKTAWELAIASGPPQAVALAGVLLGDLLKEQGDIAGAKAAYQQARDSGVDRWAPAAVDRLRGLPGEQDPGR